MIRWLACFAIVFIASIAATGGVMAAASGNASITTATSWCYSLINTTGGGSGGVTGTAIISPLIECFTDTVQGIIPSVTTSFLAAAKTDYAPLVGVMCLLAIAYYGARIMIGDVQRLKASTFILGLKMGAIYIFLNNAPSVYTHMINTMQWLSVTISNAATTAHSTGFCVGGGASGSSATDTSQWQEGLWSRWDCIFQFLLGFSTAGFAATSIASFLFLMLFSASAGIAVFFVGLYLILMLLTAAFRFIHVYLMAFLSLSFMFCLGYLFVPLLLFRNTFDFFRKWLILVFGFILTPVLMFGFMGMMLVALDLALFSSQYSVFCMIGGTSYCQGNSGAGASLFSTLTQNTYPSGYNTTGGNQYLSNSLTQLAYIALENPKSMTSGGSGGLSMTNPCTSQNGGVLGWVCNMSTSGSKYQASGHYEEQQLGMEQTGLNLSTLAGMAGSTCTATSMGGGTSGSGYSPITYYSNCPYLQRVLISVCVAALIVWIMSALLTYIPTLASNLTQDLVNQDLASMGAKAIQSSVFGQSGASGLLGLGKETAMGAATGAKSGGVGGAVSGGLSGGMRMLDSLLMGDR